jgi:hypothetical protein
VAHRRQKRRFGLVGSLGLDARRLGGIGALVQFIDQPRILDRDHRLRREILQQRDLLLGKRPSLRSAYDEGAQRSAILHQGNPDQTTHSGFHRRPAQRIVRPIEFVLCQIGDLDQVLSADDPQQQRMCARFTPAAEQRRDFGGEPLRCSQPGVLTVKNPEIAGAAVAQTHRPFEHRVEHRRELAGRGIDDTQYLGGCGLLLQCLARLGDQPRVLHRNDRLRSEVLQHRDLLFGERAHFLAVDVDSAEECLVLAQRN